MFLQRHSAAQPIRASASRHSRLRVVQVRAFNEESKDGKAGPKPAVAAAPTAATEQYAALLHQDAVSKLAPQELSTALLAYVLQRHPEPNSGQVLETSANASSIFSNVARIVTMGAGRTNFDAQSLLRVLQAYAASGEAANHRDFLAICAVIMSAKLAQLGPADLSALAATCASLELGSSELLAALASRSHEVLAEFDAADLVTLLSALAQLGHSSPALFHDAADVLTGPSQDGLGLTAGLDHGRQGLACLLPRTVAQAVWALAAVQYYHQPLFDAAEVLLMLRLPTIDGETLARVAWSYSQVRGFDEAHRAVRDRDLFEAIAHTAVNHKVKGFTPRSMVTLLVSFCMVPHYDARLFDAVSAALGPRLACSSSSDLVALAWALARVSYSNKEFMQALGDATLGRLTSLDEQDGVQDQGCGLDRLALELDGTDLVTIAQAFPATKTYHDRLFRYLLHEAQERPELFGHVQLLELVRVFSKVQHRDPDYYGPQLQALLEQVHKVFKTTEAEGDSGMLNMFRYGYQ